MALQGRNGADVVPAMCPPQHKARVEAGPGIRTHQGIVGVDGV